MEIKPRVLAIDDDPIYLGALRQIISDEFNVLVAQNSTESDRILAQQRMDVLIIDIRLKGESGLRLVRKYVDINPEMVVILLSSNAIGSEYLQPGVDDYLLKGVEADVLKEAIWNNLYRKRMPPKIRRRRFGLLKDFLPECTDAILQPKVFFDGSRADGMVECLTGGMAKDKQEARWNVYRLLEQEEDTFAVGLPACVGCGRECRFCLYGPLKRVHTEDEIIGMFLHGLNSVHARGIFEVPRILTPSMVFAHSGDPLIQNMANTCGAIRRISAVKELGCKFILTSCGHERSLQEFIDQYIDLPIGHYWSLNACIEATRHVIMPATKGDNLISERDLYQKVGELTGIPVTGSFIVIPGINDSIEDAKAIWDLIGHGRPFIIKLQPYMAPAGHQVFPTATMEQLEAFRQMLIVCGFRPEQIRIRHVRGADKYASCGNARADLYHRHFRGTTCQIVPDFPVANRGG